MPNPLRMNPIWWRFFSEAASGAGAAPGLQGSYLPVIEASVTNPTVTYSHQEGFWLRIGQMVTFHAHMIVGTISGGSGNSHVTLPLVGHLPETGDHYDPTFPAYTSDVDWGTGKQFLYARVINGTSTMELMSVGNNAAAVNMQIGGFQAGSELAISATYWTDAA